MSDREHYPQKAGHREILGVPLWEWSGNRRQEKATGEQEEAEASRGALRLRCMPLGDSGYPG